jgi:hypothetical protein
VPGGGKKSAVKPGTRLPASVVLKKADQSIAGVVVNQDGKPEAEVVVEATLENGQAVDVRTDKAGRFTFIGLPKEPVTISAQISRYFDDDSRTYVEGKVNAQSGDKDVHLNVHPAQRPQ